MMVNGLSVSRWNNDAFSAKADDPSRSATLTDADQPPRAMGQLRVSSVRHKVVKKLTALFRRRPKSARHLPVNDYTFDPAHAAAADSGRVKIEGAESKPANAASQRNDTFDASLSGAVTDRDLIVAGALELIGLDDVQAALGADWPAVSYRVGAIAEGEIQRCLGPTDVFRSYGETGFLIHFDRLDKSAAEQKAKLTALRVKAALIRQVPEVADALAVSHFVSDVDTTSLGGLSRSLADKLFVRLMKIRREAKHLAQQDRRALIKDMQVVYSPVWHVRRQVTPLNRCILDTPLGGPSLTQVLELADPEETSRIRAQVDYLRLAKASDVLHRLVQAGRSTMLLVPVTFSTVDSHDTFAEYLRLLHATPPTYRKYLVLEVTGVPLHHPASKLGHVAAQLERFVKYVAVELPIDDDRISAVAQHGIWAISLDLSWAKSTDLRLTIQLRRFVLATRSASTFARGANSIGLALAAAKAGFTYIDGTAIHLPLKDPRLPSRLRPLPRSSRFGQRRLSRPRAHGKEERK